MNKISLKKIFLSFSMAALAATAGAVEYIDVNPVANPSDGYVGGPQGVISVYWPGVSLQMNSQDKDIKTPVDPSFVSVTVNGNPVTIDPDMTGQGKIYVGAQYESDGSTTQTRVNDQLTILLPDMFFFWEGNIQVVIKEGAVTSVSGAVNKELTLNYTFAELNYNAIWEPAQPLDGTPVKFSQGECVFYVYWEGYTDLKINSGARPFYQLENESNNGSQISASQYMSIENGKVKFDFSSFEPGTFIICLPDASINLGEGVDNGEAIYNFQIVADTSVLDFVSPYPSENDSFDGFTVKWGQTIDQPYNVSIYNEEGMSLIQVLRNGMDVIQISSVTVENTEVKVQLAQPQTSTGDIYSLRIPAGIFSLTNGSSTLTNEAVNYAFTLKSTNPGNDDDGDDDNNGGDDNGDDDNGDNGDNGDDNNGDDNGDDDGDDDGGTTGVESILMEGSNVTIYNLQGNKVNPNNLSNGIFIINGKKVVIKK